MRLDHLNAAQREAVAAGDGPLLVLAGAGTGKTRVITYRIAHLIDSGVPPEHILGVTFTNKAAREMRERVAALLGKKAPRGGPTLCTFHRLGVLILREQAERAHRRRNFSIYDRSDTAGIIREVMADLATGGADAPDADRLAEVIGNHKTRGARGGIDDPLAARIAERYEEALRDRNAFDLDDLILWPVKLLADRGLRRAYQKRFTRILVDEYQDTNQIQYELLKRLVGPSRSICVVGDDDQSIYRFRGAQREKILTFRRDFPGAKIVKLEENYRSSNGILSAANAVIARSARRHEKRLFSRLGEGARVRSIAFADEMAEAEGIVDEIKNRHLMERAALESMAVLVRSVHQARPFEERLRLRRIPYTLVGGKSWFDRKEVKDVLAHLRLVANPRDDAAFLRIVNFPRRGIGPKTLAALGQAARERGCGMGELIEAPEAIPAVGGAAAEALGELAAAVADARRSAARGFPAEGARRLIDRVRYREAARALYPDRNAADLRLRAIDVLFDSLHAFLRENRGEGLAEFIERIMLQVEVENDEEEKRTGLNLMTLHSAKGLEFDAVYLPGVEEGLLPHEKSIAEGDEAVDEERRLLYVGMTRAQRYLTISRCETRARRSSEAEIRPSRFLADIPPELLSEEDPVDLDRPLSQEEGFEYFKRLRELRG